MHHEIRVHIQHKTANLINYPIALCIFFHTKTQSTGKVFLNQVRNVGVPSRLLLAVFGWLLTVPHVLAVGL